ETLLQNVNDNEKVRKDLCQYPFKIENLKITISFESKQNIVNPERITFISARDNIIKYYHNPPTGYRVLIHEETFEEAKEKLGQK
ncbi:MAG: hypothetical protein COT84_04985, partial [Chlamydiae bacterium CG10_big_fil_rev_8_21_14_0_10_35_9]